MARLIIFAMIATLCVALALILRSTLDGPRTRASTPISEVGMIPNSIQKVAYVALIVVLFGVASGWLGGL